MRLSEKDIQDILASKGLTCSNLQEYKNLDTILQCKCKNGHSIEASMRTIRNDHFRCLLCEGKESLSKNISVISLGPKQGKRIVAIDNATEKVGISVFDNGKLVFWHLYKYSGETVDRMAQNRRFLEEVVIKQWEPDLIVLEDIQYQNNNILTFKTLAMLLGSSLVAARLANIKTETVFSKVWRSHFMIGGKTRIQQKQAAIDKVWTMYGIKVTDDVAEAILMGKYAADTYFANRPSKLF